MTPEKHLPIGRGSGVTFVDIDETVFHTFAKIAVVLDGKVVRELDNQQFNTYVLTKGETFDFSQFRDARLFATTSVPIMPVVQRLRQIIEHIKRFHEDSHLIFLTARADFDDKQQFLDTFRKIGIDVDFPNVYVERSGNKTEGTVAERKKAIVLKYLATGLYRRVRLIDDDPSNLRKFLSIQDCIPAETLALVRERHCIPVSSLQACIEYYALLVTPSGHLEQFSGSPDPLA